MRLKNIRLTKAKLKEIHLRARERYYGLYKQIHW